MAINATRGVENWAKDNDFDLSLVKGTGPNGRIGMQDIKNHTANTEDVKEQEPVEEVVSIPTEPIEETPTQEPEAVEEIQKPNKVTEIKVDAPMPQPKGAPPETEENVPFFNKLKVISENGLLHLVRFRGKTRWMSREGIIVTMRDKKVIANTDGNLAEAESLRQDVSYMEFPRYTQFTEKKR